MVTTFVPGRDMAAVRRHGYGRTVGGVVATVFCERGESHTTILHVVLRTEIQSKAKAQRRMFWENLLRDLQGE
jgi:hypothetical protein